MGGIIRGDVVESTDVLTVPETKEPAKEPAKQEEKEEEEKKSEG